MITLEKLTQELRIENLDLVVGGGKKPKSVKSLSGSSSSSASSASSATAVVLVDTK